MATVHVSNNFIQSQAKVITTIFDNSTPEAPPLWDGFFNEWDGDEVRSFFQFMPVFGFGTLGSVPEGGAVPLDAGGEGIPSFFPYTTLGLKYGVSLVGRTEDPKGISKKFPRFLRYAEDQTIEFAAWNILIQGWNPSVTLWDNQPLFSTTHLLQGTNATYNNNLANTGLSVESWQAACSLLAISLDDRGLGTFRTPFWLCGPVGLQQQIEEITTSKFYPYSDENRKNIAYGKTQPYISRYLQPQIGVGPFPWYVTAGKGEIGSDCHAMFLSFKYRHSQEVWYDNDTRNLYHSTITRFTLGTGDGRGQVGSQGA
jgi:hypothetical protein